MMTPSITGLEMHKLFDTLNVPLIQISGTAISLANILSSLAVLVLGTWLSRKARTLVTRKIAPGFNIHPSTGFALGAVSFYIGTALTLIFAISCLGFNLGNLAIVAGALSVGIGLGLQTIANNFVSGLLLLFDRSIKVGDYVELADGTRGAITQIRVRSTIIMTNDGVEVIVPNSKFLSDQVINWTLCDDARRVHVPFGVAYGSDVNRVMQLVLETARELPCAILDEDERKPRVWFTEMADSSLNFELVVWVKKPATLKPHGTLSIFLCAVHRALVKNGFEIPFPQRDVHIKSTTGQRMPEG